MKIKSDNFVRAIEEELFDFQDDKIEELEEIIDDVAKDTVKKLRSDSPKKTGKYAKGWTSKKENDGKFKKKSVIHNKVYQLTHLLEKGHAKRNGGRVEGIPHIEPAEKQAIEEIERRLRK